MTNRPAPITITDSALAQIRKLLASRGKPSAGIRVGLKTKGCSGLAYSIEFADDALPADEKVEQDGVTVFIDPRAILYIIGTKMDFTDDKIQSGFTFANPNEKGRCGCGKSFKV